MIVYYSSKFQREYKKLPKAVQEEIKIALRVFIKNPFTPKLKTHKLKGRLNWAWSFSVSETFRIIFEFHKNDIAWLHSIGDHSIYR